MIVEKEEIIKRIREMAGANPTEEFIKLMEDVEDSWQLTDGKTVEEVEKKWKKKYLERFGEGKKEEPEEREEEEVEEKTKFEELFKGEK